MQVICIIKLSSRSQVNIKSNENYYPSDDETEVVADLLMTVDE
jgi:hypothetical protein